MRSEHSRHSLTQVLYLSAKALLVSGGVFVVLQVGYITNVGGVCYNGVSNKAHRGIRRNG